MENTIAVEKHDLVLYASGVESYFEKHPERKRFVESAIECLERGEIVKLLADGKETGTIMRAVGSRYQEEKAR